MKKIILGALLAFLICGKPLHADLNDMVTVLSNELEQRSFKCHAKGSSVETYSIKYITPADGSLMHVGIWSDCVIGTVIGNAPNIGAQVIMYNNGVIFDHSNNFSSKKDHFSHKYSWGKVSSWDYKQVIERN